MNGTAQLNAPQKAGVPAKAAPAGKKVNANFLELVVASMANRLHKSKIGLMNESFNPLWNISARQAQQIYDFARTGNYAQIQRLYDEIERCDPTFLVCTTRRCSAMSVLDWRIVESDERPMRRELKKLGDSVKNLREEQIACLEESMSKIDNLPDALEHFALAAFRGYSLVNTWRNVSGDPIHLECLDHWNICLDRRNREWLWNKDGISYMNPSKDNKQMQVIPKADMVAVVRKRQIDWPAMQIFLRNSVGERDWGRFLETYGLPPVIITMPEFTSDKESAAYVAAAEQVFEGRSGVVPYGSQVNYASESRGTDPFSAFIEHQMKLFVLLATGGTLTSLAESGSGTLAGNAQMKVWEQIIFSDRRITSNAINKQLCEQILKENFKGKPILAEFQLYNKPDFTPDELADLAGKFSSAGFEMDADELTQATGFKIIKKVEETPSDPFGGDLPPPPMQTDRGDDPDPALDPADAPSPTDVTTPVATNVDAVATGPTGPTNTPGPKGPDGLPSPAGAVAPTAPQANNPPTPAPSAPAASQARQDAASRLVRSLQEDFRPVADELAKVLALPEDQRRGAATALLGKLNGLVSDDPVMADVIYEQMQEAFGIQIAKHPDGSVPAANKAVPNAKVNQ